MTRPTRRHDGQPYSLLLGLASDGVCIDPLRYRRGGGLLRRRFSITVLKGTAVSFLLHFPSGHPDRPLAGILPCEARTFLCTLKHSDRLCHSLYLLLLNGEVASSDELS